MSTRRSLLLLALNLTISACATTEPIPGKPIPIQGDRTSINQLVKNDMDRMADIEMRENTQSLRNLMTKLYKRNPHELQKSTPDNVDKMVDWVFEGDRDWKFEAIYNLQGTEAIFLAFKPEYTGDRVLPFIVGLQTMLIKAHGDKTEHFLTDSIDPQNIYNVARNFEVAAWKLSTARDIQGNLYLITNQIGDNNNLSFEREFGEMIGRTDLYAIALAEKSQRLISRVVQSLSTLFFLPF